MLILIFVLEALIFFIFRQTTGVIDSNLELISTLIIIINTIIFLFLMSKYSLSKVEYIILLFAYIIRIILLYFDIFGRDIYTLPNSGADSEMFNASARNFAQGLEVDRGGSYGILVGYLYTLFGEQRILAQYLNILFSIYTIIYLIKIMRILNVDYKIKNIMLLTIAFIPNYIIISSILLRESVMIYLITISLYFFVKWWKSSSLLMFNLAVILPIIAAFFHSGAIAPSIAYGLIYILYKPNKQRFNLGFRTILVGVIFVASFIVLNSLMGDMIFGKFEGAESMSDIASKTANPKGESAYLSGVTVDSIPEMVIYTPIRMFYFIASPLPWDWRGFNDIFAFVFSGLFFMLSFIYAFIVITKSKHGRNKNLLIALLIVTLLATVIFSWGVSNAGTALRHREKFIGIFLIMLSIAMSTISSKKGSS